MNRLKDKITKVEEGLIKQQPRLFLSNNDRGIGRSTLRSNGASTRKGSVIEEATSEQGQRIGVDRETMSKKIANIEVGPVINNFDIQKEMKARLIRKKLVKV